MRKITKLRVITALEDYLDALKKETLGNGRKSLTNNKIKARDKYLKTLNNYTKQLWEVATTPIK